MSNEVCAVAVSPKVAAWKNYLELCKPRVVLLMIVTSVVGMCLAVPFMVPWRIMLYGNLGIALAAGSAAVVNHLVDQQIDRIMRRTQNRPLVQGKVKASHAIIFSFVLCVSSMLILSIAINGLTALLAFLSLVVYAGVYTGYLKHATPQNIVIGGIAGASPPLLGWVAVTGHVSAPALLLMLIIFVWTPPHFWALAIHRVEDYAKANVPMLPHTHGIPFTKLSIVLYTILLAVITLLPVSMGMSGWLYGVVAVGLNMRFLYWAFYLKYSDRKDVPYRVFRYSINYLMYLFLALLVDHYITVYFLTH